MKRGPRTEHDRRRRTLSQNFLASGQAAERFMSTVAIGPDDLVLEVGAGEGALTGMLSHRCREVFAYEIDPHLLPRLKERTGGLANVHVVLGNFLDLRPPRETFHVAGNVPFSITSQVVDWCLRARALASATIITQLEYARKRTGDYGRWSLLTVETWPWFAWELCGRMTRDQFRPMPRVDAGVLRLSRRDRALVRSAQAGGYRRLVATGFGGVGGSLYRSLLRVYPREKVSAAFRTAGLSHDLVVAFVSPEDWLLLFTALES